jgi:predicted nucleotidyltransferase/HEPN domain-containing protein
MKSGLDHLPSRKRRELAFVVQRLREAFAGKAPDPADGRLLMIVLYGSHARGDFVDDVIGGYHSDYDILLVVDREELTDMVEVWSEVEDLLMQITLKGDLLRAPVSLIAHTLDDLNSMLARGRAFFVDVVQDGVVLHAESGVSLEAPGKVLPQVVFQEAGDYQRSGLEGAETFLRGASFYRQGGRPNEAAYALHQAAEGLYATFVLVLTLYSPKSHNLNRLRRRAEEMEPALAAVWSADGKLGRRGYERLREAYVKARHSRAYDITEAELDWVTARLVQLKALVASLTAAHLERLAGATD